jgi:hypothetical protein
MFDPNTIDGWTWNTAVTVVGSYTFESLQSRNVASEFEKLLQSITDLNLIRKSALTRSALCWAS